MVLKFSYSSLSEVFSICAEWLSNTIVGFIFSGFSIFYKSSLINSLKSSWFVLFVIVKNAFSLMLFDNAPIKVTPLNLFQCKPNSMGWCFGPHTRFFFVQAERLVSSK